jgi:flavin reductase (DIM6/NTAB) family NADH-FMN oxidoreductase RutF
MKKQTQPQHCLNLREQNGGTIYHLMTALVVPRPIALVTTLNPVGTVNAAPFSFFNAICTDPPMLAIGIARSRNGQKDTVVNILREKECVVHLPSVAQAEVVARCGDALGPLESEVEANGLVTLPSLKVRTPRLEASPVQMECRLERHIELGNGPLDLLLVEILEAHVHADLLDEQGRLMLEKMQPLARLNASDYCGLGEIFSQK